MRKFLVIILLILILTLSASFATAVYNDLSKELNAMAFVEDAQVSGKDNHLYIQMNVTFQDEKMIYYYQDIFEKAYDMLPSKSITLLIYSEGFPLLRVQSLQEDIENYINAITDRNEFIEQMAIKDIRSIEHVLYDELNLFDAQIIGIAVDQSQTIIQLESMKKTEEFQDDYIAMALTVIENTPWVNSVTFEFYKNEELIMTLRSDKENLLMTIKGTMDEKAFVDSLEVEIPESKENVDVDNEETHTVEEQTPLKNEYPLINVVSGSIDEVINGSKIFKLEVPESDEYYFKINNFESVETEMYIKDEDMNLIDDNLRDDELLEYIYIDLDAGKDYYLEVRTLNNSQEAIAISVEASSSILPVVIGIFMVFAGLVFIIVKVIKKLKQKNKK